MALALDIEPFDREWELARISLPSASDYDFAGELLYLTLIACSTSSHCALPKKVITQYVDVSTTQLVFIVSTGTTRGDYVSKLRAKRADVLLWMSIVAATIVDQD